MGSSQNPIASIRSSVLGASIFKRPITDLFDTIPVMGYHGVRKEVCNRRSLLPINHSQVFLLRGAVSCKSRLGVLGGRCGKASLSKVHVANEEQEAPS